MDLDPNVRRALSIMTEADEQLRERRAVDPQMAEFDPLLDEYGELLSQRDHASPDERAEFEKKIAVVAEKIGQIQRGQETLAGKIEAMLETTAENGAQQADINERENLLRERDDLRQELAWAFYNQLADTESEISRLWVKIDPLPASITRTTLATIYVSIRQDYDRLLEDVPVEELQRDPRQASLETWKKLVTRASRLRGRIKPLADLVELYTHGQAG